MNKKKLKSMTQMSSESVFHIVSEDTYVKLDSLDCVGNIFTKPGEPDDYGSRKSFYHFNIVANGAVVSLGYTNKNKCEAARRGLIEAWLKWQREHKSE